MHTRWAHVGRGAAGLVFGAVALLTTGYSAGRILGPVAVIPHLRHGFSHALVAAALVVVLS